MSETRTERIQAHEHEEARHAFDNNKAERFHHPQAAEDAWSATTDFLLTSIPATLKG